MTGPHFTTAGQTGYGAPDALRAVLDLVDDRELVETVQELRRNGRPGYHPRPMFRAYLASFLINAAHTNDLIRRLEDDPGLRAACGFRGALPHRTTFNRFIRRLSHHRDLVEQALVAVTSRIKEDHLPDLGEEVAVDSTCVRSHSNGNRKPYSDPEATWGVKHANNTKGKVDEWFFGHRAHMLADANHGLPLACITTTGSQGDSPLLRDVIERAEGLYDWWKPKIAIGDRGYDSLENHVWLDDRGIVAIIHMRDRRPNKEGERSLYEDIYNRKGVPTCEGGVLMDHGGDDPETGKRLFICREQGCHLKDIRAGGVLHCNDEFWLDPADNLRIFSRVPRHLDLWDVIYAKRQAIERLFKSMKESRRLERHCVRGLAMITLHVLMSSLAIQVTALAALEAGEGELLRWQVRPVA